MRVLVRSLILAIAVGAVPLASVAAHECIIANRSATGNEHATASGNRRPAMSLAVEQRPPRRLEEVLVRPPNGDRGDFL